MKMIKRIFIFIIIVGTLGAGSGYWWYHNKSVAVAAVAAADSAAGVYAKFDMEVFDTITREYWQKANESDLAQLFLLALQKAEGTTTAALVSPTRAGAESMLKAAVVRTEEGKRKALMIDTAIIVLANLAPQGRSGLLSAEQGQAFRDTVNNVDRSNDLYKVLGIGEKAPIQEVEKAFQEKQKELSKLDTPSAKQALVAAEQAHQILSDTVTKEVYDQTKIQPTVVSRIINGHTLYLDFSKISPATFNEFMTTLDRTKDHPELTGMIIDLRSNVGGTLDFAKYLLALFVGPQQYAFDLFHQGDLKPERTPAVARMDGLARFRDIALLTDNMTQSTAELTAAMFKRLRLGYSVGTKTRGWGTVENTYPIETTFDDGTKYTALLVNSLTLREDNEPIEGRGVDPSVDINDAKWRSKLNDIFHSAAFAREVAAEIDKKK